MRKTKVQAVAVAAAVFAMFLGGCGEAPYELTATEERIVVNYSAHVLAKYNKYQKDGLKYVPENEITQEVSAGEMDTEAAETADTEIADAGAEVPQIQDAMPSDLVETATWQEIFGVDGLSLSYVGARIADSYVESEAYALNADAGKRYLVVGVDISNVSETEVELNVFDSKPKFVVTLNGTITSPAELTILPTDFSTYEDTIAAGQTEETVLLFQIPDTVEQIETLKLDVSVNENDYQIILESAEN